MSSNKAQFIKTIQWIRLHRWRHDTQHNDIQHNDAQHYGLISDTQKNWHLAQMPFSINAHYVILSVVMLSVTIFICYTESHYAECRYAECYYAECYYAVSLCWVLVSWMLLCWVSWYLTDIYSLDPTEVYGGIHYTWERWQTIRNN